MRTEIDWEEAAALLLETGRPTGTERVPVQQALGRILAAAGGRAEPLIGVYDQALAGICEALLQGERTSMHCLFEKIPPKLVDYAGDKLLLLNCNTPEKYRILREADGPMSNA